MASFSLDDFKDTFHNLEDRIDYAKREDTEGCGDYEGTSAANIVWDVLLLLRIMSAWKEDLETHGRIDEDAETVLKEILCAAPEMAVGLYLGFSLEKVSDGEIVFLKLVPGNRPQSRIIGMGIKEITILPMANHPQS